jgi:hypothetical protein
MNLFQQGCSFLLCEKLQITADDAMTLEFKSRPTSDLQKIGLAPDPICDRSPQQYSRLSKLNIAASDWLTHTSRTQETCLSIHR